MSSQFDFNFSRYKKVPKIGLINLGDTSYLNAVLQCFRNIYNMANYFLDPNILIAINLNINQNPLSFIIGKVCTHLYPYPEKDEKGAYNTENIFKILKEISNFNNYKKKPPNDFLIYLLDRIHKELNKAKSLISNINKDNNQTNQRERIIKEVISNIQNSNNSIISNYFNWFNLKEYHCTQCKNIKYELKSFNTYDLNISKYYKNNHKNDITISECLQFISQINTERLCFECKILTKFIIIDRIYSSPNIFVFILDRGNMDNELIKIPFTIEEKINLNNYIEEIKAPKEYELIGIVSISLREIKYIAFCKSPIDHKWYLYNDIEVHPVSLDFVLKSHNNLHFYTPCILFYESIKNKIN